MYLLLNGGHLYYHCSGRAEVDHTTSHRQEWNSRNVHLLKVFETNLFGVKITINKRKIL